MKKEEIIKIAKQTHTIEYDYSLVEDCKLTENVKIICPKHGLFTPRLNRFLKGSNCGYCVNKRLGNLDDFILKANKQHHNYYDYSKFIYKDSHTLGIIICPKHGEFKQTPTNHLSGCGCPKCKSDKLRELFALTKEEFVEKANKIHNNKFNYSLVEYINNLTPITIICPLHGKFIQTPQNHLLGRGCPICHQSHLERQMMIFLEENNIKYEYQKRFKWLGKQSLDFYLTEYNIAIECQGKQHFSDEGIYGILMENIQKDEIKLNKCKINNIKIIYFTLESIISNNMIPQFYKTETLITSWNNLQNIIKEKEE